MGKWTQLHVETVLTDKMRSMVHSVMQDIKLNEFDPPMSFDAFVEHLDTNNAFVRQLVELMVMETADTRKYPRHSESTHISGRTFNKLQFLSSRYHVSGSRRSSTRRSEIVPPIDTERVARIPDLANAGWTDLAEEIAHDEEMLELSLGDFPLATGGLGGRYELMLQDGVDLDASIPRRRQATTPPWNASIPPLNDGTSSTTGLDATLLGRLRGSTPNPTSPPSTGPMRQQSSRRPPRGRMVDFNEYTGRLRAARRAHDGRPRTASGDFIEEDNAIASPISHAYRVDSSTDAYRDGPSDNDDPLEPFIRPRPYRQAPSSHDYATLESAVRRHLISGRLRRGGIPPPENIADIAAFQNSTHLTVGSGVTAPRSIIDGSPTTFLRSPSPLISLFEGNEHILNGHRSHSFAPSSTAARTEATHLATLRSSTPGSVGAAEGETTSSSGPVGAPEWA
ncbi:hypothetical protein DACRYDRAFT_19545 [Dacryopinax primogenitus]|uniref:Uncharacterized protein n=1 Tax=Dacryopinax primogenitus (strain DJM 731) TaxID=1858805 RepID=M5GFJ2_DACPD|nr:uncharacterized protein DACRYDRAFT_19545 [Dacryopinax primogenitus]EJU06357.1 hypothetical protein DACRYDRAFT_19545 [Dacryopinax primogenitus]